MTRSQLERRLAGLSRRDPLLADVRRAASGARASVWLVGGMVRDAALGRSADDVDLAAEGNVPGLMRALETAWRRRAFRFRKRGVTTWRLVVDGRAVDVVDARARGIDGDLRRRELTINAIAFDLGSGALHDPLGGLADLRRRVLRRPRPGVVREDPVRALRVARFVAQLPRFRVERGTRLEAAAAARGLRRASVERILDEIDSLLVAEAPHEGLAAIEAWGLLPAVLPELVPMRSCAAGKDRPDVFDHTLATLAASASTRVRFGISTLRDADDLRVLRWTLLLHDVAKPDTLGRAEDGRPTFHGHEVAGARKADAILRRLRSPRELRRRVADLVRLHLRPGHLADAGPSPRALRRLVQDAGDDLPILVVHAASDARGSGGPADAARWRRLRGVLEALLERHEAARLRPLPPLLTGDDVMAALSIPAGPEVGRVLRELRTLQEEGLLADREEALARLRDLS